MGAREVYRGVGSAGMSAFPRSPAINRPWFEGPLRAKAHKATFESHRQTQFTAFPKSARRSGEIALQTAGSGPDSPSIAILATLPVTAIGHPGNLDWYLSATKNILTEIRPWIESKCLL